MSETTEQPTSEELTATPADIFAEDTTTETPPTPEPQPPPPPQGLTPEQIRESVSAGVRDAQPAAPPRDYTPDELNRLFNVWQPTEDLVQRVLAGGQDGLQAMMEMRDGLSKQFGTLLQYQMEVVKNDLMERMTPALTFAQEQAAAKDREDFFGQNEDLRAHEQLTQTVFDALKAQGYRAPNKATAYKTLADRTRALLSGGANGSGAAPTGGATTRTPTQTKRPAQLSSGSQAGGGGPSAPAVPFPGAEIFM
jgi:hypothetical protein